MRFVYLSSVLCLQLPSDSPSRRTPLLLANGWHYQPPYRTFTDERAPMPGALEKKATGASAPIAFHTFSPILLFRPMSLRQEQCAQMLTGHNSVEHLIR